MREFALSNAQPSLQAEAFPIRLLRNWRARRQLLKLRNQEPLSLAQVGLTKSDFEWVSRLSLADDPFLALESRSGWRFDRASLDKIAVMRPIGNPLSPKPFHLRRVPSRSDKTA